MHELGELLDLAAFEERPDIEADCLRPVEIGSHLLVPALRASDLIGEDRGCGASFAGVEEEEVVPQPLERFAREGERLDVDRAVAIERVRADPAVRGDVLILLAGGLTENVDLDLARILCETPGRDGDATCERERLQETHRERAGRAQTRPRRHIGDHAHFERIAVPVAQQRLAQDRMADLGWIVDLLELRVLHPVPALEDRVGEHVDVLVDRPADQEAAVLTVVGGDDRFRLRRG